MSTLSEDERAVIGRFLEAYNKLKRDKKVKNKQEFNSLLSMPAANFSFFENEERPVPEKYIDKLCEVFHISKEWLQKNKGEMFASPLNGYAKRSDKLIDSQSVPLYAFEASAGLVKLFSNSENVLDYIKIPNLPKCDGAVHISGDSMYPLLKSGDIVMYKQIHDIEQGIFYGEMYLLSIRIDDEDFTLVKYIQKSDKGPDYVKLVSQNQYHSPKDVPISSIRALGYIKASIRINSMA